MLSCSNNADITNTAQNTSITEIFTFPAGTPGFNTYVTVFDDDPTRTLLVAASILAEYTNDVFAVSKHVVVVITDHSGQAFLSEEVRQASSMSSSRLHWSGM